MSDLSIIIPSYNERENISRLLTRLLASCDEIAIECIVVDDDSPDRTWEHVDSEFGNDPRVRVIRRINEQGLGSAVCRGIEAATGEFIGVIDADLQHPPERVPDLYNAFESGTDLVVGTRRAEGGDIENWSAAREMISKGAEALSYVAFPRSRALSDPMSGFFMFRASAVDPGQLDPTGFKILLEILARGDITGISEVSYTFQERERGESKLTSSEYVNYAEHVTRLGLISRGWDVYAEPQRIIRMFEFGAIGATGALVNTIVFLVILQMGAAYWVAGIGAFLVAVNWNFGWNWLVTYDQAERGFRYSYSKFHLTSIGGFLVYSAMLWLLFEQLGLPPVVANLSAITSGAVANFIGTEWFAIGPHLSPK